MIPGYPTLNKLGGFFLKKFYFLPILTSWWWRTPTWRPTSILTGKACWCYRWCCCWCCCCCWPALGWSWQMSSCCCCCCLLFLLFLGISYQAKREDDNLNQSSKSILRALLGKKLLQKLSMCLSNGRGTSDKIRPQKWVFFCLSCWLTVPNETEATEGSRHIQDDSNCVLGLNLDKRIKKFLFFVFRPTRWGRDGVNSIKYAPGL